MTDALYYALKDASAADFKALAEAGGMECEGPSEHGVFLARDNGGVWLFSDSRTPMFGRTVLRSVWTPLNVAVMRQEAIGHLL